MPTPDCSTLKGRSVPGGDKGIPPAPLHLLHRIFGHARDNAPGLKAAYDPIRQAWTYDLWQSTFASPSRTSNTSSSHL